MHMLVTAVIKMEHNYTLLCMGLHLMSSNAFNSRLGMNWKFMSIMLIYNIQFTTICVFIELTILEDLTILEVTLNKNNPPLYQFVSTPHNCVSYQYHPLFYIKVYQHGRALSII